MNKHDQLVKTLREHMPPQVQTAVIFETDAAGNKVNLLLIADGLSGLRAQALLAPVGRELGCRLEVHLCNPEDWAERLNSSDRFVQKILSGQMVLIRGELQHEANDSVDANLARMQHPVFKRLARALEQNVPDKTGFGRFRDRK